MNSDQLPPEPPYAGGKAAERRREQLAREFGDDSPETAPDTAEAAEEPDESGEDDNDASRSS